MRSLSCRFKNANMLFVVHWTLGSAASLNRRTEALTLHWPRFLPQWNATFVHPKRQGSKAMIITRSKSKTPLARLCSLDFLSKPQHLGDSRCRVQLSATEGNLCFLRFGIAPELGFRAGGISQCPGWRGCEWGWSSCANNEQSYNILHLFQMLPRS